jgi:hypothetical protein
MPPYGSSNRAIALSPKYVNAFAARGADTRARVTWPRDWRLRPGLTSRRVIRACGSPPGLAYVRKGDIGRAIQDFDRRGVRVARRRRTAGASADSHTSKGRTAPGAAGSGSCDHVGTAERRALGNRGFTYYMLGNDERAIADADASLTVEPRVGPDTSLLQPVWQDAAEAMSPAATRTWRRQKRSSGCGGDDGGVRRQIA